MNQRQRLAMQRTMAREAIAKLISVGEFFGCDDNDLAAQDSQKGYEQWSAKIEELKKWVDEESPIA